MDFEQCGLDDHSLPPPPFHDTLCEDCRHIYLSPLLLAPNHSTVSSFEPDSAYEDKAAIFFNRLYPNNDVKSHNCSLYTLLAECARRADIDGRLSRVRCCLRPKLRWLHTPASDSTVKGYRRANLSTAARYMSGSKNLKLSSQSDRDFLCHQQAALQRQAYKTFLRQYDTGQNQNKVSYQNFTFIVQEIAPFSYLKFQN